MANTNYDVLLRFILDESSKQKTKSGVDDLNKKLGETEKHVHDINQIGHDAGLVRAMDEAAKVAQTKLNPALKESVKHEKDLAEAAKHAAHEAHLQMKVFDAQAMLLSARASQMTKQASELTRISSRLGQFSRVGLVAGTVLVGGVFAEANRFAKEAEETGKATRATREWTKATEDLAQARSRVDAVLLREALPLLQQAAKVANEAAAFVEEHPQIVEASLKAGIFVAGLSAIGLAVSKGIQLRADQLYLAAVPVQLQAAQLMEASAQQMLVAAQLQAEAHGTEITTGLGGKTPAGGGGTGLLGTIGMIVAGLAASAAVVALVDQILERSKFGPARRNAIDQARDQGVRIYPGVLPPNERNLQAQLNRAQQQGNTQEIERLRGELDKLGEQAKVTSDDLSQAVTGLRGSAHESEIVSAFEKWQAEDARIVQEAAQRRLEIVRDAESRIAQATSQFASRVASINASAAKRAESLTSNFLKAEAQAEASYQEQRAQIIRGGGQQIQDIEEAHQERLRKMTQDHDERVEDLTSSRDALGLAKEQRRFNQERAEEARSTRLEIAKRRADLAERLAELDRQNEAESAQRLVAFQEALVENEAQRQEELKQAAAAHAEELKQIREQRAAQLRELQEGLTAERLRRREVFIEQIRDLDASLLGERNLRIQRYNEMLVDVDRFLADYRAKLASIGTATAPTHDYSGYAYTGMYRMAANGQPQYVMGGDATRAAESIIGGRLTQDAVLGALMRGAGSSRSLTINDHSRFDGRISAREVRAIKQETIGEIARELG